MRKKTSMLDSHLNKYQFGWQGPLQPISFRELKLITRWKAIDKYTDHHAGFTCDKCPERLRNTEHYDHQTNEYYWINTVRCKECKSNENKWSRFKDWFESLIKLAEENDKEIYFGSITRQHNFIGDAHEIRNVATDACLELIKDFKKMIHKKSNNVWQYYNSGVVVGEVKWKRPGTPVYDTSKDNQLWFPSYFMGIMTLGRIPMRFTEEYEAHPHCHFIGLAPKTKMPYKLLNEKAHENNMNVHFESRIKPWRARMYLSRYLNKDQPRYTDGSKPRCRGKTGNLYSYK